MNSVTRNTTKYNPRDIALAVELGATLADLIPPGADLAWWQRRIKNINLSEQPTKKRKTTRRVSARRNSTRRNYAQEVINRSMLELVDRVNGGQHPADEAMNIAERQAEWEAAHPDFNNGVAPDGAGNYGGCDDTIPF